MTSREPSRPMRTTSPVPCVNGAGTHGSAGILQRERLEDVEVVVLVGRDAEHRGEPCGRDGDVAVVLHLQDPRRPRHCRKRLSGSRGSSGRSPRRRPSARCGRRWPNVDKRSTRPLFGWTDTTWPPFASMAMSFPPAAIMLYQSPSGSKSAGRGVATGFACTNAERFATTVNPPSLTRITLAGTSGTPCPHPASSSAYSFGPTNATSWTPSTEPRWSTDEGRPPTTVVRTPSAIRECARCGR